MWGEVQKTGGHGIICTVEGGIEMSQDESKFIQQHLANERTFLAWVRTSIALIGLGFLTAGLIFQTDMEHWISALVGIGSVLLGGIVLVLAARDFFARRKGINAEKYQSSSLIIWVVFLSLAVISLLLVGLVLLMVL